MTRQRLFSPDVNVVEAARARARHVLGVADTVCSQISSGKDSTAALLLHKEAHQEMGLPGKVLAIHRDEEMVSPSVVRYIEWLKDNCSDWLEIEHYALPASQEVWVLGRREYVLLWSEQRRKEGRLVREMPKDAITAAHFGLDPNKSIPESIDYYTMQGKTGLTMFITGVRANESMMRYRACVQKLNENYIVRPFRLRQAIPLRFAKIIYDWTADDVFKFIAEHDFPYCDYYDLANLSGANARVGIPLHAVAARRLGDVVSTEPEFYDRLVECFPAIDAQRRWWKDMDVEALIRRYSDNGWDGVADCIEDNMLTPGIERRAMAFVSEFRKKHAKDPSAYSIDSLIRTLLLNEFHISAAAPTGPKTKAHTVRVAAAQAEADANSEDLQDDLR